MATLAIKMAQELGINSDQQKELQERLTLIEYNQAEKLSADGEYKALLL